MTQNISVFLNSLLFSSIFPSKTSYIFFTAVKSDVFNIRMLAILGFFSGMILNIVIGLISSLATSTFRKNIGIVSLQKSIIINTAFIFISLLGLKDVFFITISYVLLGFIVSQKHIYSLKYDKRRKITFFFIYIIINIIILAKFSLNQLNLI